MACTYIPVIIIAVGYGIAACVIRNGGWPSMVVIAKKRRGGIVWIKFGFQIIKNLVVIAQLFAILCVVR